MQLHQLLTQQHAKQARDAENHARTAAAFAVLRTRGAGGVQFPDVVDFGCTYVERPFVQYGAVVDQDALELSLPGSQMQFPSLSGYVTEWEMDGNLYTGAYVAVNVFMQFGGPAVLDVEHHFRFEGVALKRVGR